MAGGAQLRAGIMQPYFLPYIGYFQLLAHCDVFVLYDDIEYTKRGWINRNRILASGEPRTISLPLRKASDYLDVREREIAPDYNPDKMLNLFRANYHKAPHWSETLPLIERILRFPDHNLFAFVAHSIRAITEHLGLDTQLVVSSTLGVDRELRGEERVLATCTALGATEYVNPIGGLDLYRELAFAERGMQLRFLRSRLTPYEQLSSPYIEALSIVDTMMFVDPLELRSRVGSDYDIVAR